MGAEDIQMTCYIVPNFRCSADELRILDNLIRYWIDETKCSAWQAIGLDDLGKGVMPESCLSDVPEGIQKTCESELNAFVEMASTEQGVFVVMRGEKFKGMKHAVSFLRWKLKKAEKHNVSDSLVVHAYFEGQDWDELDIPDDAWVPEGCELPDDDDDTI